MLNFLFTQTPLAFLGQSFWRDEAFSYFLARRGIFEIISLSTKDFSPPLYYLLIHFWLKIFGSTEISLRSFSFLFFWATLYVVFLFLHEVLKLNFKKSLMYLILFLLNPFLSYYAFEARNYALFAFLTTLSYYSFYKKNYKLYFFATVFGLYTHYFMLLVVLSQIFFTYLTNKKSRVYEFIKKVTLKPLLIFLPWFIFVLISKNLLTASFWIGKISFKTLVNLLGILYTGYDGNMTFYSRKITWISLVIFLLIIFVLKKINKKLAEKNRLLLYFGLWGIGIPFFIIIISLVKPVFLPRYFIFSTVGFLLLLVYLLEHLKPGAKVLVLILLFIIALDFQRLQIRFRKKRDFQKTVKEVKTLAKKGDLIYVISELDFFTAKYYYPEGKIYILNKSYDEIPDFVGKVLISKSDFASSLPAYPKKAFILKSDGSYSIQALF